MSAETMSLPIPIHEKIVDDQGKPEKALVRYLSEMQKYIKSLEKRIEALEP